VARPGATPANDTPELYNQAEQAISAGDFTRAEQLLQQVIQQNPQWAGAWLDLALLAARQGQYAQSEEFLLALDVRFAPLPAPIAQAVAQLRNQLQQHIRIQSADAQAVDAGRIRQNHFLLSAGREQNANAGLQLRTLTLTLPDGDALVDVDPSSQARSALTARTALTHFGQEPWRQGFIGWQLQVQARQYSLSHLNNVELLAQASMAQAPLPGRFMLGWQTLWLDNHSVYQSPVLRWQLETPLGNLCGWQQHLQTEVRQYPRASHFDARWLAYRSTWRCQNAASRSQFHVQAASESARSAQRPGGDSQHRSWGLQHEWLNPWQMAEHNLLLRLDISRTLDSATYSPLLDNGRPRQLRKTEGQVAWSGPWASQAPWRWTVSAQKTSQRSNIQIFNQANTSIETSIWRTW
jgi:hypothetical protein